MTIRPKKPCRNKLCKHVTRNKNGFCENCQDKFKAKEKDIRKNYDKKRLPHVKVWLNSKRYINMRRRFLLKNPFCKHCAADGRHVLAKILDHIKPHQGDYKLFWDYSNLQSLCEHCHNVKTAKEDGGFGNVRR